MKQTFEVWAEQDDGEWTSMVFGTLEGIKDQRAKGLLSPSAKLYFTIIADTWEEACAVKNMKMGWEPYRPPGKAQKCPRGCGAMFYPEGSGECPNCGKIC